MKLCFGTCIIFLAVATTLTLASPLPSRLNDNVVTCGAGATCSTTKISGREYVVVDNDRFLVMAALTREGQYIRGDLSIANKMDIPQNLSPQDFRIETDSSKPRSLRYVSPSDLQKLPARAEAASLARVFLAALDTATSQQMLSSSGQDASVANDSDTGGTASKFLESTTLAPNQVVRGRVYFQHDRSSHPFNVVLPIAGVVFEFPCAIKR